MSNAPFIPATTPELSGQRDYVRSTHPWLQIDDTADFQWNAIDLPVPHLPPALAGLKIVHLSDVHFRRKWQASHDELLRKLHADVPDLILATGDWVDDKINQLQDAPLVRYLIDQLPSRLGVYSILGNHDGDLFAPHLRASKLTLINGQHRQIHIGDATLDLIGLPGVHREDLTPPLLASFPAKPPGSLRIILSHFPDQIRRVAMLQPDLFLAGHTHGGQVCLPFGIPIIRHDSLPPRYASGVHRIDRGSLHAWLIVSRGFGFAGNLPVRLFCPAEVVMMTLRLARTED